MKEENVEQPQYLFESCISACWIFFFKIFASQMQIKALHCLMFRIYLVCLYSITLMKVVLIKGAAPRCFIFIIHLSWSSHWDHKLFCNRELCPKATWHHFQRLWEKTYANSPRCETGIELRAFLLRGNSANRWSIVLWNQCDSLGIWFWIKWCEAIDIQFRLM